MSYDNDKFEMRETHGICGLPSLLWLKSDQGAFGAVFEGIPIDGPIADLAVDSPHWLSIIENKNVVVQAGGALGMYPLYYSGLFKDVYTFEPDADNYFCLDYNCKNENIHKHNVGLGSEETSKVLIRIAPNNAGMHRVVNKEQINPDAPAHLLSDVKIITIDSLGLTDCNLLHLDVELYELEVLKGAIETIVKYKPVIVVETGARVSPAHEFLKNIGYVFYKQCRMDAIYIHKTHGNG